MGHLGGVNVVLNGVVLRGQAEAVIPHGEEHIVAVHAALAGHHVHGGVGPGVAHMQALSGGIGELHQGVELGLVAVIPGLIDSGFLPFLLPLRLNGGKIVFQISHAFFRSVSSATGIYL